jgi:hypothetical protein
MYPPTHSSAVVLTLLVCGVEIALSHLAANYFIVRSTDREFGATNAELVVKVDGDERRCSVYLPYGIQAGKLSRVTYF